MTKNPLKIPTLSYPELNPFFVFCSSNEEMFYFIAIKYGLNL